MTREESIEIINKHFPSSSKDEYKDLREALLVAIDSLSADVRVKGEWIDGFSRQTCSVCKYRGYRSWKFCPNCGAEMRSRLRGTEIDGMYIDVSGDGTVIEQI